MALSEKLRGLVAFNLVMPGVQNQHEVKNSVLLPDPVSGGIRVWNRILGAGISPISGRLAHRKSRDDFFCAMLNETELVVFCFD
jgi:hypothetical protein